MNSLGYEYSSSSIYDLAFSRGPIFDLNGTTEFCVTGSENQTAMLISWSYLIKNNNSVSLDQKYFDELKN